MERIVVSLKGNLEELIAKEGVSMDSVLHSLSQDLNVLTDREIHKEYIYVNTEIYIDEVFYTVDGGFEEIVVHFEGEFTNARQDKGMSEDELMGYVKADIQKIVDIYGLKAKAVDLEYL